MKKRYWKRDPVYCITNNVIYDKNTDVLMSMSLTVASMGLIFLKHTQAVWVRNLWTELRLDQAKK